MKILITGITGFLGRHLTKYLQTNMDKCGIIGVFNSEKKYNMFHKYFPNVKCYKINLTDSNLESILSNIFVSHDIDYVIHSAAMKYVDIAEENPIETLKTNVFASDTIIKVCKKFKVKNLIALSTDKSNCPFNVYGMSKNIMERLVLNAGYSVYQGANFFGSDGSVLDIWMHQYMDKTQLTLTDPTCVRYFNDIHYICKIIVENLNNTSKIIVPNEVYKINIYVLLQAFMKVYDYDNYKITGLQHMEKKIELLDGNVKSIIDTDVDMCIELIKKYNTKYAI